MRRLTWPSAPNESGATMVFVAVTISALFGFAALGVDLSHTIYERGRIQHAADSAAFAVAYDCVSSDPDRQAECYPDTGQPTVDEFVTAESAGDEGAITNELSPAEDHVTVEVDQDVSHFFARILGIGSSAIQAKATAAWTKHLIAGEVMPYAVSLCHWMQTPYDTDALLDGGTNATVGGQGGKAETDAWKNFTNETQFDALPPETWTTCEGGVNTPPESVEVGSSDVDGIAPRTVHDGLWFSEGNCSNNISNARVRLSLGDVVCGSTLNGNQTGAAEYTPALGEIIPLAVYAPTDNWAYGGLCADDAGVLSKCPSFSTGGTPLFELEIVGFVPFRVLGCHLGGPGGTTYDCGGDDPDGLGLFGQFVTTAEGWNGDFEYGETGNNFGAVKVELVE
jgi:hypothetical protein